MNLATVRKRLGAYNRHNSADGRPRFLFRGQRKIHPSIKPTFERIPSNAVEIGQAYTVYRYAKQICQGLRGYSIDHLDGVAVLQHYGWPTPLIDLTGTAEVAVFFALHGASAGSRAVVYAIDTVKLPEECVVVDHAFLTHTPDDGGPHCRWLRQDGFAVTTRQWRSVDAARSFDLLGRPFQGALEAHEFTVADGDESQLSDVLSMAEDPIPNHLQNLLQIFCHHQFAGALSPKLADIVESMWSSVVG